jgi:hypothetical protein
MEPVISWLLDSDPAIRWQHDAAAPRLWLARHEPAGTKGLHPSARRRLEYVGTPSRWKTLRALRVLEWWEGGR